jgi:hypothetical protein
VGLVWLKVSVRVRVTVKVSVSVRVRVRVRRVRVRVRIPGFFGLRLRFTVTFTVKLAPLFSFCL